MTQIFLPGSKVQIDFTKPCSEAGHVWLEDGPRAGSCLLCGEERDED